VLFCFFVRSVLTAKTTELVELKFTWSRFFVFSCSVVSLFALGATKGDYVSHECASFCMKSAGSEQCHSYILHL